MNIKIGLLLLISLTLTISCTHSDKEYIIKNDGARLSFAEIDSIVNNMMLESKIPGLQLAIFNDKKVKYINSYGYIDSLKTKPLDNNTVIQMASIGKSIFACIVMKLVEEGRIDLDRPVYEYLDFPNKLTNSRFDYVDIKEDERFKKITGRMLLMHTAGFKNWRGNDKIQLYFEPGTQYYYSGEGIIILQGIIEHITKTNLRDLSEDYIFRPLSMDRTSYVWKDEFKGNASFGFKWDGTMHDERKDSTAMAAYSGVSSITDLSKLMTAILNNSLLHEKSTQSMLGAQHRIRTKNQFGPDALVIEPNNTKEGVELYYGLGWGILDTPDGQAFFKEGNNPGAKNLSCIFKNGTGLIVMTNSDRGNQALQYLNEKLIGNKYFPWEWESIYPFYIYNAFEALNELVDQGEDTQTLLDKYNQMNAKYDYEEYSELIFSSLGNQLLLREETDKAIEILKICTELNPESANAFNALGEAYLADAQLDLAVENFEKSLELNPDFERAIGNLRSWKEE